LFDLPDKTGGVVFQEKRIINVAWLFKPEVALSQLEELFSPQKRGKRRDSLTMYHENSALIAFLRCSFVEL
jgi:hypothetical protein